MNDLLYTLETLTADARSASAGSTEKAAAMDGRHIAILHLCELIKLGTVLSAAEYERVRIIEKEGEEMLEAARKNRQGLVEQLNIASRQHSFAKAVESTLDLPRRVGIPA
jgi:hypothetical protein